MGQDSWEKCLAPAGRPYDERDWTDTSDRSLSPYIRSKTLAGTADAA